MKRKEKEAINKKIISYYENVAGRSREATVAHFLSEGIPKSTLYKTIRRYNETQRTTYLKPGGRQPTKATPEMLERVRRLYAEQPSISNRQAARILQVPPTTLAYIREKKLGVKGPKVIQDKEERVHEDQAVAPALAMKREVGNLVSWSEHEEGSPCPEPSSPDVEAPVVDFEGDNPTRTCFLCDANNAKELDFSRPLSSVTLPGPADVERSEGVVCFLMKILGMEGEDIANLMRESNGENLSEWMISLCADPNCWGSVEKAFDTWRQIKELEVELRKQRKGILERIRSSGPSRRTEDDQALLNERVRKVVKLVKPDDQIQLMEVDVEEQLKLKLEPQDDDDFSEGEHFSPFEDVSFDDVTSTPVTVKFEVGGDGDTSCRRSSRARRSTTKFKIDVKSSNRRIPDGDDVRKGTNNKSKLKTLKLKGSAGSGSPEEAIYSCQKCPDLGKMNLDKFIAHIAFHSRNPHKCSECNFYFPSGENAEEVVRKHWEERHPGSSETPEVIHIPALEATGKIWLCSRSKCKQEFASSEERDEHELTVHGIEASSGGKFNCLLCPSKLRNAKELRLHKAIHHPEDAMLSCCYCPTQIGIESEKEGIRFLNLDQLKTHISTVHPKRLRKNGNRPYFIPFLQTCPICGLVISFKDFSKLENHLGTEHDLKLYESYSCPVCFKRMRYADAWNHTKLLHWPDAPREFVCQFCGKGFRSKENRSAHEQIHKNKESRPYQCELCGKSFAVRNYLTIHRRVTHQRLFSPSVARGRKPPQSKALHKGDDASIGNQAHGSTAER